MKSNTYETRALRSAHELKCFMQAATFNLINSHFIIFGKVAAALCADVASIFSLEPIDSKKFCLKNNVIQQTLAF